MKEFLNSNLFQTLAVIVAGLVAYIVYRKQKYDHKKDAANSILLEIQSAERTISKVRETVRNGRLEIDATILQSDSWTKYKYLFNRDFDKDEWDAITDFYNRARLLDGAIKYNNTAFANDVEQIRANRQRILANYAKDLIKHASSSQEQNPDQLMQDFNSKVSVFDQIYMGKQGEFAYNPQKPIDDAKVYLEDLKTITTTTAGQKLKKLARAK